MKFLNKIFCKKRKNIDDNELLEYYIKLAKIVTFCDNNILEKVKEIIFNTDNYIRDNIYDFDNRCIDIEKESRDILIYIAFIDLLINNGYAEEFDWKCELEDFEYLFLDLKQFKNHFVNCKIENLDLDETLVEWAGNLNCNWVEYNVSIMNFDIDSDSYILLPVSTEYVDYLEKIGEKINKNISLFDI